jgi:hypothetical protein
MRVAGLFRRCSSIERRLMGVTRSIPASQQAIRTVRTVRREQAKTH